MSNYYYNFFLGNWKKGISLEIHLKKAVELGYITQAEMEEIMATPKDI